MSESRAFVGLVKRELIRWTRSPIGIFSGLIQPILYLALFGQALNLGKLIEIPGVPALAIQKAFSGAPTYFSYFSVGMVGFITVFSTLFIGANVIFDKRLGLIKKALSSPVNRTTIFAARLVGGAIQPAILSGVVFAVALLFAHVSGLSGLVVTATVTPVGVLEIVLAVVCLAIVFASVFLAIGFLMDQPQSYFGIINLLNLPILFTSNALFPVSIMPPWLQTATAYNPVSIGINVMRENLFPWQGYYPYPPEVYLAALVIFTIVVFFLAFLLARRGLSAR
ncbi:MAG: ABC transporter permease [Thermoplasmata archaeon]